jgi:hypothetical protein
MNIKDLNAEQLAEIKVIKDGLRISKVVCTRAVKTKRGDFFVGMSAAWDTMQEDAGGQGASLIDGMDEGEQHAAIMQNGMTVKQAKIAGLVLGMNVDLQAGMNAVGGGAISEDEFEQAAKAIKRKYGSLLAGTVVGKNGNGNGDA